MEKSPKVKSGVFPKEMDPKMIKKGQFYEAFSKVNNLEKICLKNEV